MSEFLELPKIPEEVWQELARVQRLQNELTCLGCEVNVHLSIALRDGEETLITVEEMLEAYALRTQCAL